MPTITDLGFRFNRRELKAQPTTQSGDVSEYDFNRSEPIQPDVKSEIVEVAQAFPSGSINFEKLTIDRIYVGQLLESSNFETGVAGWRIRGDGDVEFNNGTFRGALSASTIDIGGADATSFHVDINGNMWVGAAAFDIATNPFAVANDGTMRATAGNIGGFDLGDDYIRDVADSMGMASAVTGGDDVRFWAGDTFANRNTAPFRVYESGAVFMSSATIDGVLVASKGTFGGDGSDGSKTVSVDETLNPAYQTFNYTDLTIDVTKTLSFGSNYQNKVVVIKVQGDCIINGTLSVKGGGSLGGAGGNVAANGVDGSVINTDVLDALAHQGIKGLAGTNAGGAGGAALTLTGIAVVYCTQSKKIVWLLPGVGGAGGGGGAAVGAATGGAGGSISALPVAGTNGSNLAGGGGAGGGGGGGAGGGAIRLEVAGNLTIGGAGIIDVSGQDGANGGTGGNTTTTGHGGPGGGAGGGGTGGMALILYNGTLSNSGTIDISGGDGGTGGAEGNGTSGAGSTIGGSGGGGGGFVSGAGGQGGDASSANPGDASLLGDAGAGGGGGAGIRGDATAGGGPGGTGGAGNASSGRSLVAKNVEFA